MCMGKDEDENETLLISSQQKLINSIEVEILVLKIDRKSSFHIKSIFSKLGQNLSALLRNSSYLKDKKKVIYNAIIKSQFNYFLLVWMFCSRKSNNLVNKVQE